MRKQSRYSRLREEAKKLLAERSLHHPDEYIENIEKLLEELSIHQIELELQQQEQEKSNQALEQTRKRYHQLYEDAPVGYFTLTENSLIVEVNHMGSQLTGYPKERLINSPLISLIAQDSRLTFVTHIKRAFATDEMQHDEICLMDKNGHLKYLQMQSAVYYDSDYKQALCRTTASDISQQKKLEKQLKTSEKRFRTIFSEDQTSKLLVSPGTGTIIDANQAACHFYGYTLQELLEKSLADLSLDERSTVKKMLEQSFRHEKNYFLTHHRKATDKDCVVELYATPIIFDDEDLLFLLIHDVTQQYQYQLELQQANTRFRSLLDNFDAWVLGLKKEDGQTIWISINTEPVFVKEGALPQAVVSTFVDITRLRNTEIELRKLNATKDKFLSILSHDLRSPFNTLLGFSELLYNNYHKYDDKKRQLFIKNLYETTRSTYNLLENLLTWSRLQRDNIRFNPKEDDLISCLLATCELFSAQAAAKKITFNMPESELLIAYFDRAMIEVVLRNLLSNALKFTDKGGSISIELSDSAEAVSLSVIDSGVGVPKDKLNSLFRIDRQFSTPGTQSESGSGLGLILCKEFIERHGGTIGVESQEKKGSTFWFSLPKNNKRANDNSQENN